MTAYSWNVNFSGACSFKNCIVVGNFKLDIINDAANHYLITTSELLLEAHKQQYMVPYWKNHYQFYTVHMNI